MDEQGQHNDKAKANGNGKHQHKRKQTKTNGSNRTSKRGSSSFTGKSKSRRNEVGAKVPTNKFTERSSSSCKGGKSNSSNAVDQTSTSLALQKSSNDASSAKGKTTGIKYRRFESWAWAYEIYKKKNHGKHPSGNIHQETSKSMAKTMIWEVGCIICVRHILVSNCRS